MDMMLLVEEEEEGEEVINTDTKLYTKNIYT
jgi:hypothetical protein